MSTPVGPLIDTVLQRVFDPAGTGTPRATVRDLFSRCQQFVNGALDSTLVTVPLTTRQYLQVYQIEDVAPDVLRIKAVREGVRDLSRVPFRSLKHINNRWFGLTASRFETFCTLGREVLIVHPAKQSDSLVNVVYTQVLPALNVEGDLVLLPDDQIPLLLRMVEAVLLLKARDLAPLKMILDELTKGTAQAKVAA